MVDGQGNVGDIDGDNGAAMRYTEARRTEVALALLEGIDDDAVDFRDTYDGEGSEPVVLPANFPNLLANGATGIAVGMATSVPPHNVGAICDALAHLIKHPNATIAKLVEFMPGPDFPTGGILVEDRGAVGRWSCRRPSPSCSPTARPAAPSAGLPAFLHSMSSRYALRWRTCSSMRTRPSRSCWSSCPGRTFRPAAFSSRTARRLPTPMRRDAAASACARAGRSRT